MKKILVVDDEVMILELMKRFLVKEGFDIIQAKSGSEALLIMEKTDIDAVLLDVNMPEMDGFEVLRRIRGTNYLKHLPVLLVTGKDDEIDTILGLEIGADDYITKPFKQRELIARIKAVFKRIERDSEFSGKYIEFGNFKIYKEHHKVYCGEEQIELGVKEFKLLLTLVQSPNRVFTRSELLDIVWHEEVAIEERTVDVHIGRIRKKIEARSNGLFWIETVRGMGYRFNQ